MDFSVHVHASHPLQKQCATALVIVLTTNLLINPLIIFSSGTLLLLGLCHYDSKWHVSDSQPNSAFSRHLVGYGLCTVYPRSAGVYRPSNVLNHFVYGIG